MLLVVEKRNIEEVLELLRSVEKADVHIPRPLPAEIIARIDPYVKTYYMPESTLRRLSRKARAIVGNRVKIMSRRGRFAKISLETVATIIALHRSGVSIRKIAEDTGIPKSTVHYIIQRESKIEDGDIKMIVQ